MYRIVACSVNGARYLIDRTVALAYDQQPPVDEGTRFATMANVRGHVVRELNDISAYWRVDVIDDDSMTIGWGVRAGFGGTGRRWQWYGAAEV